MSSLGLIFFAATYVNGIVASIQQNPVFWTEVVCRAKVEKVRLKSPKDPQASIYIKKRVYDRLIVTYHKLGPTKQKEVCQNVAEEASLVINWLKGQQKVWGEKSSASLKELLEQLEQTYEVSWR